MSCFSKKEWLFVFECEIYKAATAELCFVLETGGVLHRFQAEGKEQQHDGAFWLSKRVVYCADVSQLELPSFVYKTG